MIAPPVPNVRWSTCRQRQDDPDMGLLSWEGKVRLRIHEDFANRDAILGAEMAEDCSVGTGQNGSRPFIEIFFRRFGQGVACR